MSDSRLQKLAGFLESRNRTLRIEAIDALVQSSAFNDQYSQSQIWEGRVAAAELLQNFLYKAENQFQEQLSYWMRPQNNYSGFMDCANEIGRLNLEELLEQFQAFVSCEETPDNKNVPPILNNQQRKQQRQLIDQHLDMNSSTGVSSQFFITDDELSNSNSSASASYESHNYKGTNNNKTMLKKSIGFDDIQLEEMLPNIKSEPDVKNEPLEEEAHKDFEEQQQFRLFLANFYKFLMEELLQNLVDPKWHIRHGAALALGKICIQADKWLFKLPKILTAVLTRLLQLLTLDRFFDFVSGSNAVAPVRETATQALSFLLIKLQEVREENAIESNKDYTGDLASEILGKICALLQMQKDQHWHCRQTALLTAKYHFAVSKFTHSIEHQLFQSALNALQFDTVDEVVSSASQAFCSLFTNPSIDAIKAQMANEIIARLWIILRNAQKLAQLREGVDSVLMDFLTLLAYWLQANPLSTLGGTQLNLVVELVDCSAQHCPTSRTQKALECICSILSNPQRARTDTTWGEELIFQLIKRLYRCVIFCPPSAASTFLPHCQQTLELLLNYAAQTSNGMDKLLNNNLTLSIGLWISCLLYEHKNPEIDVFLHNIDGLGSRRDLPKELMCSEEIRFMNKTQIDETILERKVTAANWLAPLLDALFQHGRPIAQQPMFISVQLLFSPYLQSNSLYQKLGAALVIHAWALYRHGKNYEDAPIPAILTKEIEQQLSNGPSKSKLYDEVVLLVNLLSKECNEFQQYCVRKGMPRSELLPLDQGNSMENVILSCYQNCERRLKRADDRQALNARYAFILELIESTKFGVRTYTNRVNALFSSALFYFANQVPLPTQLTPLIKPLVEALDSENSSFLASQLLANAFPTLFLRTAQREPCPHAKVLKQLSQGLGQCEIYSPKMGKWANPEFQYRLLSIDRLETENASEPPVMSTKARNCTLVLKGICAKFGDRLPEICPEMLNGQCASLEMKNIEGNSTNLEPFLLRVDFVRTIFPTITNSLRESIINEMIRPKICNFMELLGHQNPAVRYRIAQFIAELTAVELCSMLKLVYEPLEQMISGSFSTSNFARCGAAELLAILSSLGEKMLGVVSLLAILALRIIGDQLETVRAAAAFAFRQFVILLPIENRKKHFLHALVEHGKDEQPPPICTAYLNSFSLVDVLNSPGNLPKLRQEEISWLRTNVNLRAYQIEGITWLSFLRRFGLNGILADDMGLGKTLQTLSLLAWDYNQRLTMKNSNIYGSLIVCPRTLIDHWIMEWHSYFPGAGIPACKISDWKEGKCEKTSMDFILVISYEELRGNRALMSECRWHYVILDEGHSIRNPSSQLFEAVCALQCAHRLILSGTPVQNSPADLWALLTFLMPGYLSSRAHFQAKYMRQIMACRNPKASEQQIKEGEKALQLLHKQCLPFIMRRLKSEVLAELPEKIVQDRNCELSQLQRKFYEMLVERCSLVKTAKNVDETDKWLTPLQLLHALRKLVDHPFLVADLVGMVGGTTGGQLLTECGFCNKKKEMSIEHSGKMLALKELLIECQIGDKLAAKEVGKISKKRKSADQQPQNGPSTSGTDLANTGVDTGTSNASSPLESKANPFAFATTSECSTGVAPLISTAMAPHRALVFCQWRATIELIAQFLDNGSFGTAINYLRLDGTTPVSERQTLVNRFNADPSIDLLLLTTHIGGLGLNLTGADVVIFVDHDWNPFRDLQAIDRAHRLGQQRTVNVYRLITQGTVEEKVMRLQRFKADTANALVGADNRSLASMATDELLELFTLGTAPSGKECAPKKAKKPRLAQDEQANWTMDKLWGGQGEEEADEQLAQYAEQHSIETFLQSTARK